jgi:hypothetical protein
MKPYLYVYRGDRYVADDPLSLGKAPAESLMTKGYTVEARIRHPDQPFEYTLWSAAEDAPWVVQFSTSRRACWVVANDWPDLLTVLGAVLPVVKAGEPQVREPSPQRPQPSPQRPQGKVRPVVVP